MYISADLFQSSSVLAYSCRPPMTSNPDKHTTAITQYLPILSSIQASRHPCIHGCINLLYLYCIILKGHHFRGTGRHRLPTPWPQNPWLHGSLILILHHLEGAPLSWHRAPQSANTLAPESNKSP